MDTLVKRATPTAIDPVIAPGMVPIVLDLGKEKKKSIRNLKRGRGKLMGEVASAINEVRLRLGEDVDGKQLVPVVLIYRQKRRRNKGGRSLLFPFL